MTDSALRSKFLDGMSHAAFTVSVVTTDGSAGRAGITVSAMSPVSAETPRPTLLICVHNGSLASRCIGDNGVFCVNLLRDNQARVSDIFAGRLRERVKDKFDCADWLAMPSGSPRLVDVLVAFDCRVASCKQIGAHYVFFGEVQDIFIAEGGAPLIYAKRAYGATRAPAPTDSLQRDSGKAQSSRSV